MQIFAEVSNGFIILHQNTTNANSTSVTIKLNNLTKIWKLQQWHVSKIVLQSGKPHVFFFPVKHHNFLHQLVQRRSNGMEIFDEAAIEICKAKKTPHLYDCLGAAASS